MDFTEYYQQKFFLPSGTINKITKKYRVQQEHFLSWFIGFIEGDGSYYTNQKDPTLEVLNKNIFKTNFENKPKKLSFEITQKDPRLLFFIRKNLGFGLVYPFTNKDRIYYRYYTSKKENIFKIVALLNGNLILEKRKKQFEFWLSIINQKWFLLIPLKPCKQSPSLKNGWVSGFVEADGGFYTNVKTGFRKSGGYYNYLLKMYITQKGEKPTLTNIRDLFGATTIIQEFQNTERSICYNRLEINSLDSREQIIAYFQKFPLKGMKNIHYKRWVRIHNYQKNKINIRTERSATKLQRLVQSIEERPLLEFFNQNMDILQLYLLSNSNTAIDFVISQGLQENIEKIQIVKDIWESSRITDSLDIEDSEEL
uniref:Putative LAGLIDADG homing endonuclease n=1 Tax=Jenufa perforata TaxID=993091 RepID=A0A0S2LNK0_9CHLO|nr:putative LAGLIDADG homing endonuclease [Jenufa perforata]ALO62919.1 putative LAGLIDADG homing endonuclease [Jenufa perforata]